MEMMEKCAKFSKDIDELKAALMGGLNDSALCDMSDENFRLMRAAMRCIKSGTELIEEQTITMKRIESKLDRLLETAK